MSAASLLKGPIFVAGHQGLVGSAIERRLRAGGASDLLLRKRTELDLRSAAAVDRFFAEHRPRYVFLAAAKVGGIEANRSQPVEFLRDNLQIQTNVIDAAYRHGARKLLFLGSSCIYPRAAPQPMKEEYLLTGALEPTNEWYAIAKIAGLKMCQAYRREYGFDAICAMPTNLYGPGDNFDLASSHVVPALMRKIDAAKRAGADKVEIWGSGTPKREFLYADACVFLMRRYDGYDHVNIGTGAELTIRELAETIARVVGYRGGFTYDAGKPDGSPRKLLDSARLARLGWRATTGLEEGLRRSYAWYLANRRDAA